MASNPSYDIELDFAVKLAFKAGEIILRASKDRAGGKGGTINDKKNRIDLVTETDQAVEKMVSESLRERFPDHKFVPSPHDQMKKKNEKT
jgi:myo-inositol-1(or 4)-monophosphatase